MKDKTPVKDTYSKRPVESVDEISVPIYEGQWMGRGNTLSKLWKNIKEGMNL